MVNAYGVAVCLMTVLIAVFYSFVIVLHWKQHWTLGLAFGIVFVGLTSISLLRYSEKSQTEVGSHC